ncbi:putative RNA polymerase II C-terminal domain phosphatase-like 3 [Tripterygium wilfordii]|uniref:protein-serine/threonine phosphatase n=2 Tax=Tripterygium wilfordii TaxID=458696 RepID=A0A7J7DJH3_TRIWF|nr:putative RNA polymerase II C-terminal domain phosphatase-like 3 [Tripterygium wilfordii]
MGEDEKNNGVVHAEEGEVSESADVEEISALDFIKQENRKVEESKSSKGDSRVWTMQDLYKYRVCGGYVNSGLYNLAWAQAVQNKPLNKVFVEAEPDENSSKPCSSGASVNGKEVDKVVIDKSGDEMDAEKEEGELEEGEIDLDSEPVTEAANVNGEECTDIDALDSDALIIGESGKGVNLIREALESINVMDAKTSFQGVCSRLQSILESLQEMVSESNVPTKDLVIQLLFTKIQVVDSAFCAMDNALKGHNRGMFLRILSLVKSHSPPLFSPDKMKEIEAMLTCLASADTFLSAGPGNKEKEIKVSVGLNKEAIDGLAGNAGHDLIPVNKVHQIVQPFDHNKSGTSSEALRPVVSGFRGRGSLLPLLDLHKDHDLDSLPSPTHETTPVLPVRGALGVANGIIRPSLAAGKVAQNIEGSRTHPYETDALKAVSFYQQKFNRNSFLTTDLPSPTPSVESGGGDGDTGGEVSSSSTVGNLIMGQSMASPYPSLDTSNMHGLITTRNATSVVSANNSSIKPPTKTRDPRLRFVNPESGALDLNQGPSLVVHNKRKMESAADIMNLWKQKTPEDPSSKGPASKRQRNMPDNFGDVKNVRTVTSSGGWLEDCDVIGPQTLGRSRLTENAEPDQKKVDSLASSGKHNVMVGEQVSVTSTNTKASFPNILKDIAVNPTMLINILKMGQRQSLAVEAQQKAADPVKNTILTPSSNSKLGAVPSVSVTPVTHAGMLPTPSATLQLSSQIATTEESGKICMKPRDPRRVLHGNALQRIGSLGSEQLKMNGPPTSITQGNKDNQNAQKLGHTQTKPMTSQPSALPDISLPFTNNLKNIANIVSVPQASVIPPVVSQNLPSPPTPIQMERMDMNTVVSNSESHQVGDPEVGAAGTHPQNTWGDLEHLFEGYDEQQKAAIQRERARRIDEQNKMFAARKLCLVLDLDHTLLNSAKFVEIDRIHEEILRKKEEQDREKPERHLFRFPHMGMWTKLRPGIWNFLEKASKLFELHLYTMGNKVYATEMAKVLDPKGVLFNGRVISKGDDADLFDGDERVPKSKDLEGVLGMESAVVIIDDSVRVWPHNRLNLIVVERYTYFPCSRRQFGLQGPSLLEVDLDERLEDGTLASSLTVIERIHQNFFTHQSLEEADVRNILASEQRKILGGCRIVFSRVFPVGEANPHLHPLWQMAEQFGAVCTNQIDDQVTHVVAHSLGTDKVNWALSSGRFVVHPNW